MTKNHRTGFAVAVLSACLALSNAACSGGGGNEASSDPEIAGEISLELQSVPSAVQCISVSVAAAPGTGSTVTVTRSVAVTANQTAPLALQQLPLGGVIVNASAYAVACSAIASNTPTWLADQQTTVLIAGQAQSLALVFRQNLATQGSANFLPTIKKIVAGYSQTLAVLADGDISLWGAGATPPVRMGLTGVVDAGLGALGNGCALKSDGTVWCWGDNRYGQLGNGTTNSSVAPVKVSSSAVFAQLSVGYSHVCATTAFSSSAANQTYCWGSNMRGEIGDSTTINRLVPTLNSFVGPSVVTGDEFSCGINALGNVYCWGAADDSRLGSATADVLCPYCASAIASDFGSMPALSGVVQVALGDNWGCARKADGSVACWGSNHDDALGVGGGVNSSVTARATWAGNAIALTSNCLVDNNGGTYCWGDGGYGQTGIGAAFIVATPTFVNLSGAAQVSHTGDSQHTCALTGSGFPYCWGTDFQGESTGRADITHWYPVPVPNW